MRWMDGWMQKRGAFYGWSNTSRAHRWMDGYRLLNWSGDLGLSGGVVQNTSSLHNNANNIIDHYVFVAIAIAIPILSLYSVPFLDHPSSSSRLLNLMDSSFVGITVVTPVISIRVTILTTVYRDWSDALLWCDSMCWFACVCAPHVIRRKSF